MKYVVLLGDGMADYPIPKIGYKTPLQVAKTPNMDFIAYHGLVGRVQTLPSGFPLGSDIANLTILGYDPREYYTGRAPLEAGSIGIELSPEDVAFRCNLVTLSADQRMDDFSADHISTEEAGEIIKELNQALGSAEIQFYTGVSYRNLMVWKGGQEAFELTPPHDITGQLIQSYLPKGNGADFILELIRDSQHILDRLPVNQRRIEEEKKPANSIWLWGQGKAPHLLPFKKKYRIKGAMISAVDLLKGIGKYAGLEIVNVPGATGFIDTNYQGKAEYGLKKLKSNDFIYIHVEAPDEASHSGDLQTKIRAIEDFDRMVVGTILEGIKQFGEYKILLLPDHFTPIDKMTHTKEPVPFAILQSGNDNEQGAKVNFDEESIGKSSLYFEKGYELMDFFIKGT